MIKKNILRFCLAFSLSASLLAGCGRQADSVSKSCPFSDLTWTNTVADMEKSEGTEHETYDSVYGGTTYTYPKEYEGVSGTVKYMYDEEEKLASIAWAYGSDDADELRRLYDTIHADLVAVHGDSSYNNEKETNYGDVWYLEDGNIIISVMITGSQKALQFAYISPTHSTDKDNQK